MSIEAKCLIQAQYASDGVMTVYGEGQPVGQRTIIDKFTATNTDSSSRTLTVHIVPSGGTAGSENIITSAKSIAAGASVDLEELKNQILEYGDLIAAVASVPGKVVIRASGRKILGG